MNEPSPTAVVGWNHFNCDPNSTGCNLRGTPTRGLHRLVPGVNRVGRGGRAQKRSQTERLGEFMGGQKLCERRG